MFLFRNAHTTYFGVLRLGYSHNLIKMLSASVCGCQTGTNRNRCTQRLVMHEQQEFRQESIEGVFLFSPLPSLLFLSLPPLQSPFPSLRLSFPSPSLSSP